MFKRWASFILICVVMLTSMSVFADVPQEPEIHYITVTEDSRKYAMALLDHFDQAKVTKRIEDKRVLY